MTRDTPPNAPIAIIGLGCRYPDARNPKELWENVLTRRQSFRRMPDERLPLSEYADTDKSAPDKTYAQRAAVIDGFEFDWARRLIPKQVFEQTDIAHWLALDVALQALHDAGYEPKDLPRDRTGVVVGNTLTGEQQRSHLLRGRWPFVQKTIRAAGVKKGLDGGTLEELVAETEAIYKSFFPAPNEDTLAGALANTIAGRICNYMDLRGGGYTVDGACSSSLLSVATAANALCAGDIDVAFAGGVDVSLDAFELVGFAKVGALSDSDMKVYDRGGNGFLPGEGCGFIIMKRLDDAQRDGDYVYAVLQGWGISSDGKGGITAPTVDGQALALRRAYDRAGYSAHQLDFVEGHGTGTTVGDPIELGAISSTIDSFGEAEPHRCGVTSFKSLVGHTKAAAGIGGLLKAIAGVNRRVIPPTAGCDDPHEAFTTKATNLYPVRTGACRDAEATLTAGVSAMGFGGINSHVTLTSGGAPAADLTPELDERALLASRQDTELFVLAASDLTALSQRIERLRDVVAGMSIGEMPDLAASLATEVEAPAPVRAALVAQSPHDLATRLELLEKAIDAAPDGSATHTFQTPDRRVLLTVGAEAPRVGFLFPGQGSQRVNMARMLVERFEWARDLVERADGWLAEIGIEPVSPRIYRDTERDLNGEQAKAWMHALTQTEVAQPAICLASLLWLRFMEELGVEPAAVAGHSLGELTAFHAAGALDEKAVIQLAALRGKLMGEAPADGTMASLRCDPDEARSLLEKVDGYVVVANINSATQTVVSGDRDAVKRAVELATNTGIRARELPVSAAFHSAHFDDTVSALAGAPMLHGSAAPTQARLYSTMTGAALEGEIDLAAHFSEQVVRPVNFRAVARLATNDCDLLVEVGPGAVLSGLSNETAGVDGTACLPIESQAGRDRDLNTAIGTLFAHGAPLHLSKLCDRRLIRRFRSAAELSFFVNPCEKDVLDADTAAEVSTMRSIRTEPVSGIRPIAPKLERHESIPPTAPSTDVRGVLLDAIHAQTGFPTDMLTDDLRMIDDLHMDSIKTVQVVVDVAVAVGYAGDFDPAHIANATLAEIVTEIETRMASAKEGRSGSLSPTRAAEIAKNYPGWTRSFVMHWQDAVLPDPPEDFWSGRSVCILDDGSRAATELWETTRTKGAEVSAVPASATADIDANLVVSMLSDEAMGPDVPQQFESITDLLASIAVGLPLSSSGDEPQTVVFVQRRSAKGGLLDWGLDGFVAALHLERKGLRFRVLTVDESVDIENLCAMIAKEAETEPQYDAARYFGPSRRRVARPEILPRSALSKRAKQLDASDVVLVTGGARGITAECALGLARETGAHMVLVGSSPSPRQEPSSKNAAEIQKTLDRFESEGLGAEYVQCDITDEAEVAALVAAARRKTGRVNAVIHGAAVNRPRRAHEVTADEARDEIEAKLIGALNLFNAFERDAPSIFCAFTSVIGVTGMPNNAWYAFANQALDRSLAMFAASHPDTDAVSMAFSIWDEVGMGANLGSIEGLATLGTDAIPVEEGVRRFLELFTKDPGDQQVVVTGRLGGIDTWRPEFPALPKGTRFLEDVRFFQPGVELVARTHLDLERDAYLNDHEYKGSYLFPTVFGLEAMAQAVAYVLERHELPSLSIHDLRLKKPLLIDSSRGLEIEVSARVVEDAAEGTAVQLGIRSEQTGFGSDHFTSRFVLGAPRNLEAAATTSEAPGTSIAPDRDLYGPILFQGPRFQRIAQVRALDRDLCVFDANESPEGAFVLGDPYLRDSLLQSLQLCALPDQCLPVHINRIDIGDPNRVDFEVRHCTARIHERTEDAYVGSVICAGVNGEAVETLVDYHAKIVESRDDWPTAEELARGETAVEPRELDAPQEAGGWDGGLLYRDVPGYGPQKQVAFFYRFPLTAQDSSGPSGTLGFANLYRWAGKVREISGINRPGAYSELMKMLASQDLTAATNSFETRILGSTSPHDLIEARYWADEVTRSAVSTIYEWWRIPFPPGSSRPELFAWTRMNISAVKVLKHGHVTTTQWPDFFFQFLNSMGPKDGSPTVEPEPRHGLGETLFVQSPETAREAIVEETLQTGFEDANVVGNIYFANYGAWQARALDRMTLAIAPELLKDPNPPVFLRCVGTGTAHVREAVPFDQILVQCFVSSVHEHGLRLDFDYSRVGDDGRLAKLATGHAEAAWMQRTSGSALTVTSWPEDAQARLFRLIGAKTAPEKAAGWP